MNQKDIEKARQEFGNYDGCITTNQGIKFNLFSPKPEMINIFDIAKGLSYKGHFAGQTPKFFSIAQHSLLVVDRLPFRWKDKTEIHLAALLHDAAEAYVGDMVKPLKIHLPVFQEVENEITRVIFSVFGIRYDLLDTIKKYDLEAQIIEYETFYKKANTLQYLTPEQSQAAFMACYWDLINKMPKDKTLLGLRGTQGAKEGEPWFKNQEEFDSPEFDSEKQSLNCDKCGKPTIGFCYPCSENGGH